MIEPGTTAEPDERELLAAEEVAALIGIGRDDGLHYIDL